MVVGGTRAIGLEIVKHYAAAGDTVVLTGRDPDNVAAAVAEATAAAATAGRGGSVSGLAFDLAEPTSIGSALAGVGPVRHLVLAAIDRDHNSVADYDIARAIRLVTLKLVGLHGGRARAAGSPRRRRPRCSCSVAWPRSGPIPARLTVTTVNGGVTGLTRTLVEELRPIRVNSIHPGVVGDSPYWAEKPEAIARYTSATPTGRLAAMSDIVGASVFLLENAAVNGVDLLVDGGWHCR